MQTFSLSFKLKILFFVAFALSLVSNNTLLYFGLSHYDTANYYVRWFLYPLALPIGFASILGLVFRKILIRIHTTLRKDRNSFFANFFVFSSVWTALMMGILVNTDWGILKELSLKQRENLLNVELLNLDSKSTKASHWSFKEAEPLANCGHYSYVISRNQYNQQKTRTFVFWACTLKNQQDLEQKISVWWTSRSKSKPTKDQILGGRLIHDTWARAHFTKAIQNSGFKIHNEENIVLLEEDTENLPALLALAKKSLSWSFTIYNLILLLLLIFLTASGLWSLKSEEHLNQNESIKPPL